MLNRLISAAAVLAFFFLGVPWIVGLLVTHDATGEAHFFWEAEEDPSQINVEEAIEMLRERQEAVNEARNLIDRISEE